jgi:N-acetylmuramoyl-L-alanine amidase
VPSVLIELGYLSSREDETTMNTNRWRKRMADSIARAVDTYFRRSRPEHKADAKP